MGQTVDKACNFRNLNCVTDNIQALSTDAFQVGTVANAVGTAPNGVYYYMAWGRQAPATAVTLASFTATRHAERGAFVHWRTGFEQHNLGFRLWREDESGRTVLEVKSPR
jgi:hypothetical protein